MARVAPSANRRHDKTTAVVLRHNDLDALALGASEERARESILFAYPFSAFILEPHADETRVTGTDVRQPELDLPTVGFGMNVAWVDSNTGFSSVPEFAPPDAGLQRRDEKRRRGYDYRHNRESERRR